MKHSTPGQHRFLSRQRKARRFGGLSIAYSERAVRIFSQPLDFRCARGYVVSTFIFTVLTLACSALGKCISNIPSW